MANQPKLVLTEMFEHKITMGLSSDSDIDVTHEMHTYSFTVECDDPDKMSQQWTSYSEGKKTQVVKDAFSRQ